ncbi:MAG: sugar phosphate isomerase/epimerase, partial [Clostridia bacterium]|nr:sugar phosphate isomerase/epimerase [Clostridia bacterium]
MNYEYGLQMYSVRDLTETDLAGALRAVGELGYKHVEFAGFFGHTADEVCRYMEEAGVTVSGTHSPWTDLTPDKIDETIAFHKAIGNKNYIIPGAKLGSLALIDEFIQVVNPAQEKLAANGISLGFHNHSVEFETKYWGSTIHTELEKRTALSFEIDTYWAFNA